VPGLLLHPSDVLHAQLYPLVNRAEHHPNIIKPLKRTYTSHQQRGC
jgi:hypothetical protein